MSRGRRPKPNLVRVICTRSYHRDEPKFKQNGFRLVELMELLPMADGGYTHNGLGMSPAVIYPVKPHAGEPVYIFSYTCELNIQRQRRKLMPHVLALYEAAGVLPGTTRVDLDITTL